MLSLKLFMGVLLSRFVIALSFFVGFVHLGAESSFAENFRKSIRWKDKRLQIQFIGELNKDNDREYFSGPFGVSLGIDNRIYVVDDLAHRVLVFDKNRKLAETIGKKGTRPGDFAWLDAATMDSEGKLYVADTGNDRVQILDRNRVVLKHFGRRGEKPGFFKNPRGIALDRKNRVYVADWGNHRVQIFDEKGRFLSSIGHLGKKESEFDGPICLFIDSDELIYVCDFKNHRIQV